MASNLFASTLVVEHAVHGLCPAEAMQESICSGGLAALEKDAPCWRHTISSPDALQSTRSPALLLPLRA